MNCPHCEDRGGVWRKSPTYEFKAYECDCCGLIASDDYVAGLNARDLKRATGAHAERMSFNPYERAFHEQWLEKIRTPHFLNHGYNTLQLLLSRSRCSMDMFEAYRPVSEEERPTERDYYIAASIVQWLGSNMGRCFIEEATKRGDELAREAATKPKPEGG